MSYDLTVAFTTPLLDPYGEAVESIGNLMSLRDLVTQSQTIHPAWTAQEVLAWIDEHGHIDYLVAEEHLPADCRAELLDLIREAMLANVLDGTIGTTPRADA